MGIVVTFTDKYQKCIDACNRCEQACLECFRACLNEPDVNKRISCIAILTECAAICGKAVCFMSSDAQFAKDLCKLCAAICDKCAESCEMFTDDHCKKCAAECKTCSNECKMMAY